MSQPPGPGGSALPAAKPDAAQWRVGASRAAPAEPSDPERSRLAGLRRAVADDLFPLAGGERPLRARSLLAGAAGLAGVTALSLLRQPGAGALDTVWAEDGSVFLAQALNEPFSATLPQAFVGYLHLVPRTAAALAVQFPVARVATVMALTAALLTAMAAATVYLATAGHLRARGLRALLAAAVVLQPAAGLEALNSVAFLQWHLAFAAFWAALWRPTTWAGTAVASAVLFVTVLSAPVVTILLPVIVVRALLIPRSRDLWPVLAYGAGAAVQIWTVLTHPTLNAPAGSLPELLEVYVERVVTPALLGLELGVRVEAALDVPVPALALGLLVVVLAAGLWRGAAHRLTLLLAMATSLVTFLLSVYLRGAASQMAIDARGVVESFGASRYALLPTLLVLSAVALVVDQWAARFTGPARAALLLAVGAAAVPVWGLDFTIANQRAPGPRWSDEVRGAVEGCREGRDPAQLELSPEPGEFTVTVTCAALPP